MLLIHVLAQAAVAAAPAEPAADLQGVESYAPAFFAAQQPSTALDMIGRIPGFSLDNGASVRGFEGAAGNVLIDGQRPASKSDDLSDILRRLPASSVARIDVIRGGAPGIDMQGQTVLANVIRTKGGGLKGMVEAKDFIVHDGRHSGGVRLDASGGSDGRAWDVSAQGRRFVDDGAGDGLSMRTFGSGAPAQPYYINAEADQQQYFGTAAYEAPALGGRLKVNGRLFSEKYKSEEADQFFAPSPGIETDTFTKFVTESEIGGSFHRALGAQTDLEAIALRQTRDTEVRDIFFDGTRRSDFTRASDLTESIGRLVAKRRFGTKLSFELGGETAVNKQDSATRFSVDGSAVSLPAANVEVKEERRELFLKTSWRPTPQWTFDAGLRYETSDISADGDAPLNKTLRYAKPRLAITWAPTTSTQIRVRGEREVGQLDFNDFVASANLTTTGSVLAGNPDLDPEQAWVVEAALEQRFWTSGSITLTFRHAELSDVVDRAPITGANGTVFDAPANIGDGTKDEIAIELTLPTDKLGLAKGQLKGSVRRGWTEVVDPTTFQARGISGYQPVDWEVSFSQDIPRWNLTWGVDIYGSFRERSYSFNQIADFKLGSLVRPYVEVRPRPDLNLRLEIFNATQHTLRDINTVFPGSRRDGGIPDVQVRNQTHTPYGVVVRLQKRFGG